MTDSLRWSFTAGTTGSRVTVYEREPGGVLSARCWDPSLRQGRGGMRRLSLGHRDKHKAERYAIREAAKLEEGTAELQVSRITLGRLFAEYLTHHSPTKSRTQQADDRRRAEMWTRVLGGTREPHTIRKQDLQRFEGARRSGALDARGFAVEVPDRRPLRIRPVEADINWLRWCCNWATKWEDATGRPLLRDNPVRYVPEREKNVRRPVASTDRYEAVRAVADQVLMEDRTQGGRTPCRSYLSEILDIAHGTGRRIAAICQLRAEDVRLEVSAETGPFGAIRWPAATDKQRRESTVPMAPPVRAAVLRALGERRITAGYLFPRATRADQPIDVNRARHWLRKAEQLAGLEPQQQGCWHPYRRGFATARKHLPLTDLAAAGGWKGTETLSRCYLHPDSETMLKVVMGGAQLREVRQA
jgi:integrase